jgi:hypothetical protein
VPNKSKLKKLGLFYRVLAGFFLVCVAIGFVGVLVAIVQEPFRLQLIIMVIMLVLGGHISGSIAFTGYAPWYLLFAHDVEK